MTCKTVDLLCSKAVVFFLNGRYECEEEEDEDRRQAEGGGVDLSEKARVVIKVGESAGGAVEAGKVRQLEGKIEQNSCLVEMTGFEKDKRRNREGRLSISGLHGPGSVRKVGGGRVCRSCGGDEERGTDLGWSFLFDGQKAPARTFRSPVGLARPGLCWRPATSAKLGR